MIKTKDNILIGLSGGADSVLLTYILHDLSGELDFSIAAVHINHCLRGKESDSDEIYSRNFAKTLDIDFHSSRRDVKALADKQHISVEMAAREIRYGVFDTTAKEIAADKIATAHHLDDLVETMFYRMFKGTGVSGLHSIPCVRGNIIRPLLYVSRADIETCLQELGLEYVIDASNEDETIPRNYIRHSIVPVIENRFPGFRRKMGELYNIIGEEEKSWEKSYIRLEDIYEIKDDSIYIEKKKITDIEDFALFARFFRKLIQKHISNDFYANTYFFETLKIHIGDINGNKVIFENNDLRVVSSYNSFIIEKRGEKFANNRKYVTIIDYFKIYHNGVYLEFSRINLEQETRQSLLNNIKTRSLDSGHLCLENLDSIVVRQREDGDRLEIGRGKSKKLKDLFVDEKFTLLQRENAMVITTNDNRIIAVYIPEYGFRISPKFYIDSNTVKAFKVQVLK